MGVGMEDVDVNSMPILKILQKSSAEVDQTHKDHQTKQVTGAKAGQLYFISEAELLGDKMEIIPLSQKTLYAEWRPKGEGGGIVAHHPRTIITDDNYRKGTGKDKYKEYLGSNELKLTIYFFVLVKTAEGWKKAIMPCVSTNLKHGRSLIKQIHSFRYDDPKLKPSIFSRSFAVSTHLVHGNDNSWYEFNIVPERVLDFIDDKELMMTAVSSREDAVASLPQAEEQKALAGSEDATAVPNDDDEPF